jgi:hypothetical protein
MPPQFLKQFLTTGIPTINNNSNINNNNNNNNPPTYGKKYKGEHSTITLIVTIHQARETRLEEREFRRGRDFPAKKGELFRRKVKFFC